MDKVIWGRSDFKFNKTNDWIDNTGKPFTEEYISVEMSPHISYGRVGSGYENVSLDTTGKILGHISLKSDNTEEGE